MTIHQYFDLRAERKLKRYNSYSHQEMIKEVNEWKSIARTLWIVLMFIVVTVLYLGW